jgi:DNA repair protein SbcD/Mre11
VDILPIDLGGVRVANIHGISYPQREVKENLSLRFKRSNAPGLHIGLLHCNVGNVSDHASYSPCSVEDLEFSGMDYWALGHIHKRSIVKDGNPWIVYPGNTQGRSPKKSEQGEKGAIVVEVEDGHIQNVEFVALDTVRFLEIEIDISNSTDLAAVSHLLTINGEEIRDKNHGRAILVRATLKGRTSAHRLFSDRGTIEGLLAELRTDFEKLSPFLWWESIAYMARQDLDIESIRASAGFSSELLRFSDALRSDDEKYSSFILKNHETLIKGKTFKKTIPSPDLLSSDDIFEEAVNLSLSLLDEKESDW